AGDLSGRLPQAGGFRTVAREDVAARSRSPRLLRTGAAVIQERKVRESNPSKGGIGCAIYCVRCIVCVAACSYADAAGAGTYRPTLQEQLLIPGARASPSI